MSTKKHKADINASGGELHEHTRAGFHQPTFVATQHSPLNANQLSQTLLGMAEAITFLPQPVAAMSIK